MNSIKDWYIFMPRNDDDVDDNDYDYRHVVGEYPVRGLLGCIGSVECIHIVWDRCPTMYKNRFIGKDGFCLLLMKLFAIVANVFNLFRSAALEPETTNT